jgi:hypothetical protein
VYINAKMIPVETVPGIREGKGEKKWGRGEFKYDIFKYDIFLHCKNYTRIH